MQVQRKPLGTAPAHALLILLLGTASVAWGQPVPTGSGLKELLEEMKQSAMRYEGHLPDFNCTQSTTRKKPGSGGGKEWQTVDSFEEWVSFASSGQVTKKLVTRNGKPAKKNSPRGMIENQVLASAIVPQGIFGAKAQARFEWDHWETRAEHSVAVIRYGAIGFNDPDGKTRYELKVSGRVSFDVTTVSLVCAESFRVGPPSYPFGPVSLETDYAAIVLVDRTLILPTFALMAGSRGKI